MTAICIFRAAHIFYSQDHEENMLWGDEQARNSEGKLIPDVSVVTFMRSVSIQAFYVPVNNMIILQNKRLKPITN
jgi:hypothetical protein